jgi:hypothetical protein
MRHAGMANGPSGQRHRCTSSCTDRAPGPAIGRFHSHSNDQRRVGVAWGGSPRNSGENEPHRCTEVIFVVNLPMCWLKCRTCHARDTPWTRHSHGQLLVLCVGLGAKGGVLRQPRQRLLCGRPLTVLQRPPTWVPRLSPRLQLACWKVALLHASANASAHARRAATSAAAHRVPPSLPRHSMVPSSSLRHSQDVSRWAQTSPKLEVSAVSLWV